jgi:prepilin-type processing-associated H-X9-DG protein
LLQPYTKSFAVFKCPDAPSAFTSDTNQNAETIPTGTSGATGQDYGGQNSYGHNDLWMSPAGAYGGGAGVAPPTLAQIQRPASTIVVCDATYYGAAPDFGTDDGSTMYEGSPSNPVGSATGDTTMTQEVAYSNGQGTQYVNYYKNIGNAQWDYAGTTSAAALGDNGLIASRHTGTVNCQFADGHAKAIHYNDLIHNICYWTTDAEGPHPNCN